MSDVKADEKQIEAAEKEIDARMNSEAFATERGDWQLGMPRWGSVSVRDGETKGERVAVANIELAKRSKEDLEACCAAVVLCCAHVLLVAAVQIAVLRQARVMHGEPSSFLVVAVKSLGKVKSLSQPPIASLPGLIPEWPETHMLLRLAQFGDVQFEKTEAIMKEKGDGLSVILRLGKSAGSEKAATAATTTAKEGGGLHALDDPDFQRPIPVLIRDFKKTAASA